MLCKKCGNEMPDDSSFCPKCGTAVESTKDTVKVSQFKELLQAKNFKIIIGIIALIIVVIVGVIVLTSKSPIEGVSTSLYKEGMKQADYYMSDEFAKKYYEESLAEGVEVYSSVLQNEIDTKRSELLAKCNNDSEKTFVRACVSVMKNGLMKASLYSMIEATTEKAELAGKTDTLEYKNVIAQSKEAYETLDGIYQELSNAKSIDDLQDVSDMYINN